MEENLNLEDAREILKHVKYRKKQLNNEIELLERQLSGDEIIRLAKASATFRESELHANLVDKLVRQRIQESKSQVIENVNKCMKSKSVKDKQGRFPTSRLTEPKKLSCERCNTQPKLPEKSTQPKKSVLVFNQPKVPNESRKKYVSNIVTNSNSRYLPIKTASVLQDNAIRNVMIAEPEELPVVLLGLTKCKPKCVSTESKGTNTVTELEKRSNMAIQTVNAWETETKKLTQDVSAQTVDTSNVKLIEIKPTKQYTIQVLPSINILPPPKINVKYEEMVELDFEEEIENPNIANLIPDENSTQSKVQSNSSGDNGDSGHYMIEKSPEIPQVDERCWTGISNPEDETLASQMSIIFYENVSQTPNRPSSAPGMFLNYSNQPHYRSTEVQYSLNVEEKAMQTSKTSQTPSKSMSWSDFTQLSLGEIPNRNTRKTQQTFGKDELSEGEILPAKSQTHQQSLRKFNKPTVKFKHYDYDTDVSIGQVNPSPTQ